MGENYRLAYGIGRFSFFICLMMLALGSSAWARPSRRTPTPSPTATPAALPQTITISSPINGATVTADTVVADNDSTSKCGGLSWYDVLYVDGRSAAYCQFSSCVFSPSAFPPGGHSIQIHAHTSNSPNPGYECAASQTVNVTIGSSSSLINEVTITAPGNGQIVSGSSVPVNVSVGPDVYSDQLMVDGFLVTSGNGNLTWNSTSVPNGQHTLTVNVFQQGGSSPIGSASVGVNVSNTSATPTATPTSSSLPQTISISSPAPGTILSASTTVADNDSTTQCGGQAWYDALYIDGNHVADCNFSSCIFSPSLFPSGTHTVAIHAHTANSPTGYDCATSQNISVSVSGAQSTPTPATTATPTPAGTATPTPNSTPTPSSAGVVTLLPAIASGQPLSGVTGDPSAIISSIYNALSYPAQSYGNYDDPDGTMGTGGTVHACCGPLLDDRQAASVVMLTPETKVATSAGNADNSYYQNFVLASSSNQSNYLSQLNAVNSGWGTGPMATVMKRVDGMCPIQNPTTAEIIQWAANKWGFNPKYGYTEACDEGDWNNTSLGDNGTSSGVFQVADRGSGHGWGPLVSANSNLARENTCYNADFFFATRWAAFHSAQQGDNLGISGETPPYNMPDAVESWFRGSVSDCPSGSDCGYQQMIYSDIISGWQNAGYANNGSNPPCWYAGGHYFNSAIPTAAPQGSGPHE
jgi:Bacterial Ig domain